MLVGSIESAKSGRKRGYVTTLVRKNKKDDDDIELPRSTSLPA